MTETEKNITVRTFSERLKMLAERSGIPLLRLAQQIGLPRSVLYDYMNGTRLPGCEQLISVAEYFNVSTDWLLGLDDREPPQ